MKKMTFLAAAAVLVACSGGSLGGASAAEPQSVDIQYPETHKGDVVDTYFGTEVADPYRWLEDNRSEETEEWVEAQNKVTFSYLKAIPYRDKVKERLQARWNYERVKQPFHEGDYIYFYRNDGLQNQDVVWRKKSDGEAEVFLNPNKFSEDGATSLDSLEFSQDGSTAAYSISEGGSCVNPPGCSR